MIDAEYIKSSCLVMLTSIRLYLFLQEFYEKILQVYHGKASIRTVYATYNKEFFGTVEKFIEISNLITKRGKYKLGEFNVDFDFVIVYHLMEVELIIEDESEAPAALEKIKRFMVEYDISKKSATAKYMQYFFERKRRIFDLLP